MPFLHRDMQDLATSIPQDMIIDTEIIGAELIKRVTIPVNGSTPPEEIAAINTDPWAQSGKYGLAWVYIGIILVFAATLYRVYNFYGDRVRIALLKDEVGKKGTSFASSITYCDQDEIGTPYPEGDTNRFFPGARARAQNQAPQSSISSIAPLNNLIAFARFILYRPIPPLKLWRFQLVFPSLSTSFIVLAGLAASMLYTFLPQPLFYETLQYGSPPLAIRAGMISVSMLPWVVLLAAKVNIISFLTGIGPERLIVFHRTGAYICSMLAVVHVVPFWWQSVHDPYGFSIYKQYFNQQYYIYTTGIAAMAPLIAIVVLALPFVRHHFYELFVWLHLPLSYVFVGLLFWHCNNYLTSWAYLYATIAFLAVSLCGRLFYLNWLNPMWPSLLIGEESAVTILPEKAIKVTVPSQKRWSPGQHAYLRMPGIAAFQSHPFTIASLCSDAFPSDYGDEYRDMTFVFRPFGGFTRKVLQTAEKKGPQKTYRAFIEGPYGGMERKISSFDQVIFFAGGSGITAICSQLLDLIQRMRDGKACTTSVYVIWAMKRPEIMEWFKEELRICREFAPPDSVFCSFYITSAKRHERRVRDSAINRLSGLVSDKVDGVKKSMSSKRSSQRYEEIELQSNYVEDEIEQEAPPQFTERPVPFFPPPPTVAGPKGSPMRTTESSISAAYGGVAPAAKGNTERAGGVHMFDFGFSRTATPSSMKPPSKPETAHVQAHVKEPDDHRTGKKSDDEPASPWRPRGDGWRTEYGRPDIPWTLKQLSHDFGRRTCVFVCGPPDMRRTVSQSVAQLQRVIWNDKNKDELFLHTENYAI